MAKIAILGFGTVGSGVYEVLCRNAAGVSRRAGEPVEVKYILDPKDFSGHPAANLFVKSIDTILQDPEVRVVIPLFLSFSVGSLPILSGICIPVFFPSPIFSA